MKIVETWDKIVRKWEEAGVQKSFSWKNPKPNV